jgi:mono/diheme cytochrome c family protein
MNRHRDKVSVMLKWRIAFALFASLGAVLTAALNLAHAQDADAKDIGKALYNAYCASCHGISGKGDGPLSSSLAKPPADLTRLKNRYGGYFPSNKIFDIIDGRKDVAAHGSREMPVWGEVFKKDDTSTAPCNTDECFYGKFWRGRILALMNYLRTLQVSYPAGSAPKK